MKEQDRIVNLAKAMGVNTHEEVTIRAIDVLEWVTIHQSVGEKIATLNTQQQRTMARYDKIGMLYLPNYLK